MNMELFDQRKKQIYREYRELIERKNRPMPGNGIFERYVYPVITADHIPIEYRYDLNPETNPYFMERIGVNATMNSGAIYLDGRYLLVVRVEGVDRKSYFAVAESDNGTDNFRFWDRPLTIPETEDPDTNIYDIRLTRHEDGWIYGIFCSERPDPASPPGIFGARAAAGVVRTRDLKSWERLPDIVSKTQQRNAYCIPNS